MSRDPQWSVWLGFDLRQAASFAVARSSLRRRMNVPVPIYGILLSELIERNLYYRPTERRGIQLWDAISEAPMSTEFAISRFFVPILAREKKLSNWAVFMDCDVLARDSATKLFSLADDRYALMCVKHHHLPPANVKMDGQQQTRYARKNWSSVVLWNLDHPAHAAITAEFLNSVPGRDLHRFSWLEDDLIGELPAEWNYLVGHTKLSNGAEPKLVHFTDGSPDMPGYENCEFANEWRDELRLWSSVG